MNDDFAGMAERCAAAVEHWRRKKINIERDGLAMIAEFANALDCDVAITVHPRDNSRIALLTARIEPPSNGDRTPL